LAQRPGAVGGSGRGGRREAERGEEQRTSGHGGWREYGILSGVVRLLFVCMGNICRSPTAEGVMRGLLREEGLEAVVQVDSAGTGAWHLGDPPDARATAAARARGVTLGGEARQITAADFDDYDLILAADRANLRDLRTLLPAEARARLHLLREFDPAADGDLDVPDPYYGGDDGFEHGLDLVEAACRGLLDELRAAGRL
jgi:low molecular weight protein-tyrosine phosphatase